MKGKVFNAVAGIAGSVKKVGGRTLLKCRKASPEILLVGGIIVGAAAIVSACFATKKVDDVTAVTNAELDEIQAQTREELESIRDDKTNTIDPVQAKKITRRGRKRSFTAYVHAIFRYARLYGPTIALFLIAVAMLTGSHAILKQRYLGTVAAYTALDESFKDYRKRIANIAGDEAEKMFYNGTGDTELSVRDPETGEEKKLTAKKQLVDKKDSPYEFDFNKYTAPLEWTNNSDHNFMYLRGIQSYMNDKLHAQGHLFLNEVLDAIGLQRTPAGAVTGWLDNSDGDCYVDFGFSDYYIDDWCDEATNAQNIHLNFNVDGVIWNKI